MKLDCEYLIVGAGLSGLTAAERLCNRYGARCVVIDRREHIGGNAYDKYDAAGVLIHAYGPHYFRSNSTRIVDYLSRFTQWHHIEYKILAFTEGRYWNFPVNLNTFEQFIGRPSTTVEMQEWLATNRVDFANIVNSEEMVVSQIGWKLYEKFFKGYSTKQWGVSPRFLDPSVCARVPIRTNRDDRYLRESFQAIPKDGYTRMMENMRDAGGERLIVKLGTDWRDFQQHVNYRHLIFTGPVDEYFDYKFGELPYRSLRFENESFSRPELLALGGTHREQGFWQPAVQVNYPGSEAFTRIVEAKHVTGQVCEATTIVREYPQEYSAGREAFYPMPTADAQMQYTKYKALAEVEPFVSFIGRLATYRYYNMDQVVGMALALCNAVYPPVLR